MYERLLDKNAQPTKEVLADYCKENATNFRLLNTYLSETYDTVQELCFPYGNSYGWCITHRKKKKLICNVFAESGAFSVMLRLTQQQFDSIYNEVSTYTQEYINHCYPCSDGGWIHYRISCDEHMKDIQTLLKIKCLK